MQFLYHKDAGKSQVVIEGDNFLHAIKAKRLKVGDTLVLRNYSQPVNYSYTITKISKKSAYASLQSQTPAHQKNPQKRIHLGWAIVEPSVVRDALPMLAQLGVEKITFIHTQRTQKNFKINLDKLKLILEKSNQQSGRVDFVQLDTASSLKDFLEKNPDAIMIDFGGLPLSQAKNAKTIVIGPEGGFTEQERTLFKNRIYSFSTTNTLKSETAAIAAVSCLSLCE